MRAQEAMWRTISQRFNQLDQLLGRDINRDHDKDRDMPRDVP
jgi:hypothetical protein